MPTLVSNFKKNAIYSNTHPLPLNAAAMLVQDEKKQKVKPLPIFLPKCRERNGTKHELKAPLSALLIFHFSFIIIIVDGSFNPNKNICEGYIWLDLQMEAN